RISACSCSDMAPFCSLRTPGGIQGGTGPKHLPAGANALPHFTMTGNATKSHSTSGNDGGRLSSSRHEGGSAVDFAFGGCNRGNHERENQSCLLHPILKS